MISTLYFTLFTQCGLPGLARELRVAAGFGAAGLGAAGLGLAAAAVGPVELAAAALCSTWGGASAAGVGSGLAAAIADQLLLHVSLFSYRLSTQARGSHHRRRPSVTRSLRAASLGPPWLWLMKAE